MERLNRTIIKTDGELVKYAPHSGAHYELGELQSIVGGQIQAIDLHDGRFLVCNEEGKLNGLPYNSTATDIAQDSNAIFENDYIVGDAIIINEEDLL